MQITLKAFKMVQAMSEETLCFTAKVVVDGKVVGDVSNEGHGGANRLHIQDADVRASVLAFINAQPPVPLDPEVYGADSKPLAMDEDLFFSLLAGEEEKKREAAKTERRNARFAFEARTRGRVAYHAVLRRGSLRTDLLFDAKVADDSAARAEAERTAARQRPPMQVESVVLL